MRRDPTWPAAAATNNEREAGRAKTEEGPVLHVLLAEDNPVNQQVLSLLLEKAGHRVTLVENGRQALEAVGQESFDLVLMDVQMPEMDGMRCARLIRAREKAVGGHVPIIAVTANALEGERQRCLQAGMDDYLTKPIRSQELFALIDRLCGRGRSGEPGRIAAGDGEGPAWLAALRETGFDDEAVARLVQTFIQTVPGRMEALAQAVAVRDAGEAARSAHKVKGALMVFQVQRAVDAAAVLERLASEGRLDALPAALAELQGLVGPLLESMKAAGG
jgi:CheY-like chemotaxis protein